MTEKQILINRGQNLSDILPNKEIPTNTILNKTLTGCGATYGEIVHAARNSIIIEPNVPVILGKKQNTHSYSPSMRELPKKMSKRSFQEKKMGSENHHNTRRIR